MARYIYANNAQSTLAGSITNVAVSANLAAGTGTLFPNPSVGVTQFAGTFTDAATGLLREIVTVTQRIGDTITMVRAQEGTTALNWAANDLFAELWTAGQAAALLQQGDSQSQSTNFADDTGSINAYVCALTPTLTANVEGMPIRVKIANGNTATSTLNAGPGIFPICFPNESALVGGELPAGGIAEFFWNATYGKYQLNSVTSGGAGSVSSGVVGTANGLTGGAGGSNKLASWSVIEILVETALGGTIYKGTSLTLNFNGAASGVNGMDTGGTPTSADLSVYLIFNPSGPTWATLGTTACNGPTYTGSHMPSGYTASSLLWSGKTDGSANIIQFAQNGKNISLPPINIFTNVTSSGWAAQTLAVAVPANATAVSGTIGTTTGSVADPGFRGIEIAATNGPGGIGEIYFTYPASMTVVDNYEGCVGFTNFPIFPSLTSGVPKLSWNAVAQATNDMRLDISGYSL